MKEIFVGYKPSGAPTLIGKLNDSFPAGRGWSGDLIEHASRVVFLTTSGRMSNNGYELDWSTNVKGRRSVALTEHAGAAALDYQTSK